MATRSTATLADVARLAGVSLATASRVVNGSDRRVRPEYVERVAAAAIELAYSPNVQAQAVARGTSTVIALVVGDVADPYFAQIAAGAMREAESEGLVVTITSTSGDPDREAAALATVTGLRPRAVVLAASRRHGAPDSTGVLALLANGAGVVSLVSDGDEVTAPPGSTPVVVGNREGATELAHALVAEGHRHFAVLAGDQSLVTARARAAGFLDGLRAAGIDPGPSRIVEGEFTRDGGFAAMSALLDAGDAVGCVFAVNDVMAMGALAAIRSKGLRPGRDIAVAGFDDVRTLADVVPALSTVHLPLERIGAEAVRVALGGAGVGTVSGRVILRASTAR